MNSAYIKVFGGNTIKAKRIELILKENAIDQEVANRLIFNKLIRSKNEQ